MLGFALGWLGHVIKTPTSPYMLIKMHKLL